MKYIYFIEADESATRPLCRKRLDIAENGANNRISLPLAAHAQSPLAGPFLAAMEDSLPMDDHPVGVSIYTYSHSTVERSKEMSAGRRV